MARAALLQSTEFQALRDRAIERLLTSRTPAGHWTGQLSSSALSTATAVNALRLADAAAAATGRPPQFGSLIRRGCDWLAATQLPDGSWGDTKQEMMNSPVNFGLKLRCNICAFEFAGMWNATLGRAILTPRVTGSGSFSLTPENERL